MFYSSEGIHVVKHIEIKDLTIEGINSLGLLIKSFDQLFFK